nr:exopolygalacturonase-like [Tanacetum cinerariifolium]
MFSFIHLLPLFFFLYVATAHNVRPTFNVLSYGANPNRFTENSNAFLRAWHAACASNTGGRVLVPRGSYVLGAVVFLGSYLDQLVVTGGGFLYGHGKTVWHLNDCAKNSHCKQLPYTMRFDFVKNTRIKHLNSANSRSGHFDLFSCNNVEMSYIQISAPYWSPNTDGIRIGLSTQIRIHDSIIKTGDDCVSMVSGTQDVDIQRVQCGPGHGFSIGSLGKYDKEQPLAVKLQCSRNVPCEDIKLKNIMLAYHGPEGPVASSCINAGGSSVGHQDSLGAWGGDVCLGRSQVRVPPGTFTPSGGIGGSKGGFRVQHTAQLDVTAGPEPLTTNKPF